MMTNKEKKLANVVFPCCSYFGDKLAYNSLLINVNDNYIDVVRLLLKFW